MWKLLITLIRRDPVRLSLVALISLFGGIASTMAVGLLAWKGAEQRDRMVMFAVLCVVSVGARVASQSTMKRIAVAHLYDLRMTLCKNLSLVSLQQLEQLGASKLHATLTEDLSAVATATSYVGLLLSDLAVIFAVFGYMAYLSPLGCVLALVAIAVTLLGVTLIGRWARPNLVQLRARIDELQGWFETIVFGAKELRLSDQRRDAVLERGLEPTAAGLARHASVEGFHTSLVSGLANVTLLATMGLMSFGFPRLGFDAIGPRFVLALLYASGPVHNVMSFLGSMQKAGVALSHVEGMGLSLSQLQTEPSSRGARPIARTVDIELEEVKYSYGETAQDGFTVGPIDLALRSGECVFIIGGNGSGKSTLLKMLLGLYPPQRGTIRMNGEAVRGSDIWWFRRHFAAVFVDYHLFDRIWDEAAASRTKLATRYLEQFQLADKVKFEGGRFSTTALSTGQRKRLALVAALLEDKPIYAFDEWAADQDPFFKRLFYEKIIPALCEAGKAVVAITHDDRYFHVADQVIKLEDGRRVEGETGQFFTRLARGRSEPPPAPAAKT